MYGTKSHVKITAGWGFLRVEGLVVTNEGFKFSVGCVVIYMMVCVCCNYSTISGGVFQYMCMSDWFTDCSGYFSTDLEEYN